MNPHPKRVVKSIDFVSDLQMASYCVISAVVAKTDPSRPKTKSIPLNQPKREFKGKIGIVVNSAETGKPIKDATIQTSVDTKGVYIVAKTVATDDKERLNFAVGRRKPATWPCRCLPPDICLPINPFDVRFL